MWTSIKESKPIAQKNYNCDACKALQECMSYKEMQESFTNEEVAIINKAKANNWQILKGEKYLYQFNTNGSKTCVWRCIHEIDAIMRKHDLYIED